MLMFLVSVLRGVGAVEERDLSPQPPTTSKESKSRLSSGRWWMVLIGLVKAVAAQVLA